jgi:mono/diheme cytochrome c family protein
MLGLSQAQGVILAIGGAIFLAIAGGVLFLRGRRAAAAAGPDIPRGMRPGPSDDDLETPLLQKLQGWGLLLVVFLVVWVPATWLFEPDRNLQQERALTTDSIRRGELGVELFSEENQTGIGCVRCHGPELEGSVILDTLQDPAVPIPTPNLTTVCGGPFTDHSFIYGLNDIYTTIEQGRRLMPSWSIRYEGALNDQQINDIVNYIVSIQDEELVPFEQNVCLNPEAQTAAVEEFLDGQITNKPNPTDNVEL